MSNKNTRKNIFCVIFKKIKMIRLSFKVIKYYFNNYHMKTFLHIDKIYQF